MVQSQSWTENPSNRNNGKKGIPAIPLTRYLPQYTLQVQQAHQKLSIGA